MGIVGPIVGSGAFLGPIVAGVLLSSVGYWRTWSVAIVIIALDLILRLAMTERPNAAECVATNADMKTERHSEADVYGPPAANAPDGDSNMTSATRFGTGSEQRKWLINPAVLDLSPITNANHSNHSPSHTRFYNTPSLNLQHS